MMEAVINDLEALFYGTTVLELRETMVVKNHIIKDDDGKATAVWTVEWFIVVKLLKLVFLPKKMKMMDESVKVFGLYSWGGRIYPNGGGQNSASQMLEKFLFPADIKRADLCFPEEKKKALFGKGTNGCA